MIQINFDEFEPANALGSRSGIHKVGCFYWVLKNLPPWLTSSSEMVFVTLLCSSLDIKCYGYEKILSTITNDLISLEKPFVVTTWKGELYECMGAQVMFVADNLAFHAVMGFVESFAAGQCCEKCLTYTKDFRKTFSEYDCLRRTPDSIRKLVEIACERGPTS